MKLTRDSLTLTIVALIAAMGYLVTMPPMWQWTYYQWLNAALAALLFLSGKLSTSPLAGENDPTKINTSHLPMVLLACVLGLGLTFGCGGPVSIALPSTLPATVQMTDAQLRAAADRTLSAFDAAQDLLSEAVTEEKAVERLMPTDVQPQVRAVLHRINDGIVTGAVTLKRSALTWADIKGAIDPVLANVQTLVDLVHGLPSSQGGCIGARLAALIQWAQSLARSFSGGHPLIEGVR